MGIQIKAVWCCDCEGCTATTRRYDNETPDGWVKLYTSARPVCYCPEHAAEYLALENEPSEEAI